MWPDHFAALGDCIQQERGELGCETTGKSAAEMGTDAAMARGFLGQDIIFSLKDDPRLGKKKTQKTNKKTF